ncbi:MAG: succinate dehydrogenase cytochrome b subunit [Bradymonadaceae bacterium]
MIPLKKVLDSSIGRKFVMSISGIALVLFVIVHLLGNMALYVKDGGDTFNQYAAALHGFGPVLTVAEIGLLAVFVIHIAWAFMISMKNRRARGGSYDQGIQTKGGPSNLSPFSRNMFITGVVLLVFLVIHVGNFRIGKYQRDAMEVDGVLIYDTFGLAIEKFTNPFWVAFYVIAIAFMGFHLRHGFWSALQSLGAMKPEWSKAIYTVGLFVALLLALGFLGIPIFIFIAYGGV